MRKKLFLLMLALVASALANVFTPAPANACSGRIIHCRPDPDICCPLRLNCQCP